REWDLIGSGQIMVALICLTYAIKELGKPQVDLIAFVIALLVGACVLTLFVRRQKRSAAPLIDLDLFRNIQFLLGVIAASVMSATLIGFELVFSQRLQLVSGYSPLQAGLLILPIPLAAFFAGPLMGSLQPKLGAARLLWLSLMVSAVGSLWYLFIFDGAILWWSVALAVFGFGAGAAITGASTAIINNAPASRAGMAASIEEVAYELGGAMGVTIFGSIMSVIYTMKLVLPADFSVSGIVRDSLDQAHLVAEQLPPEQSQRLLSVAFASFDYAFIGVVIVVTAMLFMTAGIIYFMNLRSAGAVSAGVGAGH